MLQKRIIKASPDIRSTKYPEAPSMDKNKIQHGGKDCRAVDDADVNGFGRNTGENMTKN
jgi:hypothetical protein